MYVYVYIYSFYTSILYIYIYHMFPKFRTNNNDVTNFRNNTTFFIL